MSWTFTTIRPDGGELSIEIPNAQFQDTEQFRRRQAKTLTQAGYVHVQDLGREDRFVAASWTYLTEAHRGDLLSFFGAAGTRWQGRPFDVVVSGGGLPAVIGTAMTVLGTAVGTGQGWLVGQQVQPASVGITSLCLDQADLQFVQVRNSRFDLSLRFRRREA